jgi:pimeloyl-ACP methyl ester carboxylesterase
MRIGAEYPDLAKAVIMLDPGLPRAGGGPRGGGPAGQRGGAPGGRRGGAATTPATQTAGRGAPARSPQAPDRLSVNMFGSPETLVAQNNYRFEDLVATCRRQSPKWDIVDCQYWALSKKQYHGAYTNEARQAMSGTMGTGDSLAKIPVPSLVLKADASPEVRQANEEAAKVMQKGKLVHIEGGGHNLHHDELRRTVDVLTEFLSAL